MRYTIYGLYGYGGGMLELEHTETKEETINRVLALATAEENCRFVAITATANVRFHPTVMTVETDWREWRNE